jgi:hypothetical protein
MYQPLSLYFFGFMRPQNWWSTGLLAINATYASGRIQSKIELSQL